MKSNKKPIKKQCFLKYWLLLVIADHDTTHFGCLLDNQRLQNTTEVDATCLLPPDLVVAT